MSERSHRHHWRFYFPGILTRRKLRVTPLCTWKLVGQERYEYLKGPRNKFQCPRCHKTYVVVEPPDGEPMKRGCRTPGLWFLRKKVVPNAL